MKRVIHFISIVVFASFAFLAAVYAQRGPGEKNRPRIALASLPCAGVEMPFSAFRLPWGKKEASANACSYVSSGNQLTRLEYFKGPNGEFRFFDLSASTDDPNRIIVFLEGGPRGSPASIGFSEFDLFYPANLNRELGARVLSPEYLGTVMRSRYPDADIDPAAIEINAFIVALKRAYPRAAISLVAHSAGALVGLRTLETSRFPISLTLIGPPLWSLKRLVLDPRGTDIPQNVATAPARFFAGQTGSTKAIVTNQLDKVRSFSGNRFDWNLTRMVSTLSPAKRRCLQIVVGSSDARIGIAALPAFKRRFIDVPVSIIAGLKHQPSTIAQSIAVVEAMKSHRRQACSPAY